MRFEPLPRGVIQPAPRIEAVVVDKRTHIIPAAHELLDEVGTDEPVGAGDQDFHYFSLFVFIVRTSAETKHEP